MKSHTNNLTNLFTGVVRPKIFIDFDGTISKADVIDAILEKFADDRWLEVEREWLAGNIGSRECLKKQFSFVKATPEELFRFVDTLEIDEGFHSIIRFCRETDLSIHIISDGFEEYIRRLLERYVNDQFEMERVTISANSLYSLGGDRWDTSFPYFEEVCMDGCATCKPAVMQLHNPYSANMIFVGDGLSDRFAAEEATVVFAKSKLAAHCHKNMIPHIAYRTLTDVANSLENACALTDIQIADPMASWGEAI